jgi:hypothetical protein
MAIFRHKASVLPARRSTSNRPDEPSPRVTGDRRTLVGSCCAVIQVAQEMGRARALLGDHDHNH